MVYLYLNLFVNHHYDHHYDQTVLVGGFNPYGKILVLFSWEYYFHIWKKQFMFQTTKQFIPFNSHIITKPPLLIPP